MGTSKSGAELAGKLGRCAALYSRMDSTTVHEAAKVTEATIKAGSPSSLRGVGKGAKLDVKSTFGAYGDGSKALVFAVGPWQLIERDTHAHIITPKGARGLGAGKGSRAKAASSLLGVAPSLSGLKIGFGKGAVLKLGDRFAAYVHHPGTKGKHPFAKGVAEAIPIVDRVFENQSTIPLRTVF